MAAVLTNPPLSDSSLALTPTLASRSDRGVQGCIMFFFGKRQKLIELNARMCHSLDCKCFGDHNPRGACKICSRYDLQDCALQASRLFQKRAVVHRVASWTIGSLSHRMYSSICFRESTPPQNRQLILHCY